MKNMVKKVLKSIKKKEYIPIPNVVYKEKILDGKVALITGGSSGIGLEIARQFLKNGCKVIISGTNEQKMKKVIKEENNEFLKYIVINVKQINMLEKLISQAADLFNGKIDILVNSAGVVVKNSFFDIEEEEYDNIMDTNAKGTFFVSKYIAKHMIKNKIKGHILNITSSSALRPAWTPYQMSKWAVRGFTLGLADILVKYGITVNCLAPGPTATPMLGFNEKDSIYEEDYPTKRYAMPEEIANMAVVLVSDLGDLVIGQSVYVTGGSGVIDMHK